MSNSTSDSSNIGNLYDSQSYMLSGDGGSGGASVSQSAFFKSVDLGAESKLMNFSQLMAEAAVDDDDEDDSSAFIEDQISGTSSRDSKSSINHHQQHQQPNNESFDERFRRAQMEILPSHSGHSNLTMATHTGLNRVVLNEDTLGVAATRLGEETFTVHGFIRNDRQNLNDVITVGQSVQLVSNPDLLKIWCSSVNALFLTRDPSSRSNRLRQYDAEWIEGMVSMKHPGQGLYGTYAYFKSFLICWSSSSNGSVKMFIERARGQVAITMGPVGGCEVTHTFSFRQSPTGVHVTNSVKVDRTNARICFMPHKVKEFILPSIASHMEQAIESLDDLIRLIQIGPEAFIQSKYPSATTGLYPDNDGGSTPLLSSVL